MPNTIPSSKYRSAYFTDSTSIAFSFFPLFALFFFCFECSVTFFPVFLGISSSFPSALSLHLSFKGIPPLLLSSCVSLSLSPVGVNLYNFSNANSLPLSPCRYGNQEGNNGRKCYSIILLSFPSFVLFSVLSSPCLSLFFEPLCFSLSPRISLPLIRFWRSFYIENDSNSMTLNMTSLLV
ncbi:hypothetical protein H112_00716 [Trichophyton rubrum D6]|uniref:Uncharacterized protein n=2 Tax=Trichophyton rubrum TaxID=5551 RepID=A0A080WXV5_TRIRC|nr:uncharacterized protein TERG_12603 [Trichophyton rubrum CBS 118892]EZF27293.1 hypothetical protein H100_00717 [Trichophyton rubrum MR850]EZF46355.1 hypothetical protein H102_00706 [Trichophyton rubrum CBS 100081]EZF56979.1 hypothetical protein H103_00714 [Trichophyton rubrum CBS 288.86]EZF67608.1 hypothetical protein H104_00701 [Trichophyton rubrum CBS 289.86]EZF88899.1 hypothetical protein H110_00717 [Trichophyton rubrum MR1448]EZF99727.1 hypothetical protein H113_00716 [Trichophyton rubr